MFRQNEPLSDFIRYLAQPLPLLVCEHRRNALNKGLQAFLGEAAIPLALLHLIEQRGKQLILAFAFILGYLLLYLLGLGLFFLRNFPRNSLIDIFPFSPCKIF